MITYNWKIESLDCEINHGELQNVIKNVHWRYIGTSELGTSLDVYGLQSLGSPSIEDFIPTDSLTNDIVAEWLEKDFSTLKQVDNIDKDAPVVYEKTSKLEDMKKLIEERIYIIENPTNVIITLN
jgi:hypothetical protein